MKLFKFDWKFFIFIALVVSFTPILFYRLNFGLSNPSKIFKDWVDFSTYWSPFLVTSLTILLAYISWLSLELMKLKEKPIIVFEKKPKKEGGDEYLSFRNIGSGPALEVKLFMKVENQNIQFNPFLQSHGINKYLEEIEKRCQYHYFVSSFSLSQGETIFIDWEDSVEKICVVYSDIYNRKSSLVWTESGATNFEFDQVGVDPNGFKGGKMIFKKDKSVNKKYDQIFSLAEVGKKTYNFVV